MLLHCGGLQNNKEQAYRYGLSAWRKYRDKPNNDMALIDRGLLGETEELPADGLIAQVPIHAVAVWDTVGAYGILRYSDEKRLDVFRFTDNTLNTKVKLGFHAVSLDEERGDFELTL